MVELKLVDLFKRCVMTISADYQNVCLYYPQHIIPISKLNQPSDLYSICNNLNLEVFAYGIYWKQILIKIGISHPAQSARIHTDTFGERLVRQVSKSPGWGKPFINSSNGKTSGIYVVNYGYISESPNSLEFKDLIEEYNKRHNVTIHKDEMYIHIWNLTTLDSENYHFDNTDRGREHKAMYFEGVLIDQFKTDNLGNVPLGNTKQDPSTHNRAFTKPKITHSVAQMFDGI